MLAEGISQITKESSKFRTNRAFAAVAEEGRAGRGKRSKASLRDLDTGNVAPCQGHRGRAMRAAVSAQVPFDGRLRPAFQGGQVV